MPNRGVHAFDVEEQHDLMSRRCHVPAVRQITLVKPVLYPDFVEMRNVGTQLHLPFVGVPDDFE